jgi:hypothetical protein
MGSHLQLCVAALPGTHASWQGWGFPGKNGFVQNLKQSTCEYIPAFKFDFIPEL